jgi:hypothetical protein
MIGQKDHLKKSIRLWVNAAGISIKLLHLVFFIPCCNSTLKVDLLTHLTSLQYIFFQHICECVATLVSTCLKQHLNLAVSFFFPLVCLCVCVCVLQI